MSETRMPLGVEQRISKAFGVGNLGDAGKVIEVDPGADAVIITDEVGGDTTPWPLEYTVDAPAPADETGAATELTEGASWDSGAHLTEY